MVVLYTDGITEGENANGQDLGREQFLAWARLRDNDETLLVLQREHEPLAVMLGEVAGSYAVGQLGKALRRNS